MFVFALRLLLGLLALFFGYFLGRVATRQRRQNLPQSRTITWLLRTVVCLAGVLWSRGLDVVSIVFLVLTAASIGTGVYLESRPRHIEETHLFPDR